MINLVHNACLWGQGQFDGWMIAKAQYRVLGGEPPASCETLKKKASSRYALLETNAYDPGGRLCRSLEIFLMDPRAYGRSGPVHLPERAAPHNRASIQFTAGGLRQFLADSGDANSIHQGAAPVVPGLWILSRLKDLYCLDLKTMELSIRFLHPVRTDEDILLDRAGNRITGRLGDTACFILTIS